MQHRLGVEEKEYEPLKLVHKRLVSALKRYVFFSNVSHHEFIYNNYIIVRKKSILTKQCLLPCVYKMIANNCITTRR